MEENVGKDSDANNQRNKGTRGPPSRMRDHLGLGRPTTRRILYNAAGKKDQIAQAMSKGRLMHGFFYAGDIFPTRQFHSSPR